VDKPLSKTWHVYRKEKTMKKILFGALSVVSLTGLVACGSPTANADGVSEMPTDEMALDAEANPNMAEEAPAKAEMPADVTDGMAGEASAVSDSDLEMTIQENLATLYPDTPFDVTSEAGVVTIAGNIPTQEEADYIADWVSEIKGVTEVEVVPSEGEEAL
jgi:hyperosmotically inducible protein